jgi:hypothetical protein
MHSSKEAFSLGRAFGFEVWECHPESLCHWRFRAEEARTVADQMTHEGARTIMRRIAMDYDRLAKLAEEQIADQEKRNVEN